MSMWTAPGIEEAPGFESGRHGLCLLTTIVVCFSFGWRSLSGILCVRAYHDV